MGLKYGNQQEKWFGFFGFFCFPAYAKVLRNVSTKPFPLPATHFRLGMDMARTVHLTAFIQGHNYQFTSMYSFSPLIYFILKKGYKRQ